MITPKLNGTKVVFGPCRLSYVHLFSKYSMEGDHENGKYMTNVIIPKSETETLKAVRAAIAEAEKEGITGKWNGKKPVGLYNPLRDAEDTKRAEEEVYQDAFFLNAKAATRPGVVDRNGNAIMDEEEVYSGMWAIVSLSFYPFKKSGSVGIGCGLNNVMKYKDDERLGGRVSANADFADLGIDTETDDDL